MVNCLKKPYR